MERGIENQFPIERALIGISASSALISAACISGLPSAQCTSLAQTYYLAIKGFGATSLSSILILLAFNFFPAENNSGYRIRLSFITFVVGLCFVFVGALISGARNIQIAVNYCLAGPENEMTSRLHQPIELIDPIDFRTIWLRH